MAMLSIDDILPILVSPGSHQGLERDETHLVTLDSRERFPIDQHGIPQFAEKAVSLDAKRQRAHYDKIAEAYFANLAYPHTQEYMAYLDRCLFKVVGGGSLGQMAELCCGHGEAIELLKGRYERALGVDISPAMLSVAAQQHCDKPCGLLQGDVTKLPLADGCVDSVVMLGGIHHVPDRAGLFAEVFRILRPGGRFIWREPVSDFFLWRWLRAIVYRLSPILDHRTEAPLQLTETQAVLEAAGLELQDWRTAGLVGFCLFMNSDVLVFNRLFRYVPGIRTITGGFIRADDWLVRVKPFRPMGLQVIGQAVRPNT